MNNPTSILHCTVQRRSHYLVDPDCETFHGDTEPILAARFHEGDNLLTAG